MGKITQTKELFEQLQSRIKLHLKENEIPCPHCNGLRFIYEEFPKNDTAYIRNCTACHTGKMYLCEFCGKAIGIGRCDCKASGKARLQRLIDSTHKKEQQYFEKATKVKLEDYYGKFLIDDDLIDCNEILDYLRELKDNDKILPKFLFATYSTEAININLLDNIKDQANDNGYEEMYCNLDTESPLLKTAQELVCQWQADQGDALCVYDIDYKIAVLMPEI